MESGEVSMSEVSQIFEIVHAEVSFGFHCREHRYVLYGYLFDPNWDVPNYEMFPERAIITFLSTDMDPAQKTLGTVKVVSEEHALINIFEVTIRLPEHHLSSVREILMGFDPTLNGLDLTLTYHKDNLPEIDSLGAVEPLHDFDIKYVISKIQYLIWCTIEVVANVINVVTLVDMLAVSAIDDYG